MKFFRFRKPSVKTILGITKVEKKIKKDLGFYEITKITNAPENFKRKLLRKAGYYSEPLKILRNGLPKPAGGCLISLLFNYFFVLLVIYFLAK